MSKGQSVWTHEVVAVLLFAISAVICPRMLAAQGFYNGSSLYVDGASIHVDGDLQNHGLVVNNGSIAFTRDWSCQGSYSGTGIVRAEGQSPQRMAHFGQNIFALVIDGWGTKYVDGKINITHELTLEKGIVEVSSSDELALAEDAVASGGSRDSYVDGALTVEGTGYRFFPIGKDGKYAPLEFLQVTGEPARYSLEVFEGGPTVSVENTVVKSVLYWQRRDQSGSFGGSAVAVHYDPALFSNAEKMIMLSGTNWDAPFGVVPGTLEARNEKKFVTQTPITAPLIALGEVIDGWTDADFYLPTALSPNATHVENRTLRIFGERLSADQFQLTVFNRWGAVVFETRSLDKMKNNGWDGRSLSGDPLMAGAYPYKMTGIDKTGRKLEKEGVITIVY